MNYMDRLTRATQEAQQMGVRAGYQMAADLFCAALHLQYGFGRDRLIRLSECVAELNTEYGKAWRCEPDSDAAQEHIDRVLREACGDRFVPFGVRNDSVKKFNYGGKRK